MLWRWSRTRTPDNATTAASCSAAFWGNLYNGRRYTEINCHQETRLRFGNSAIWHCDSTNDARLDWQCSHSCQDGWNHVIRVTMGQGEEVDLGGMREVAEFSWMRRTIDTGKDCCRNCLNVYDWLLYEWTDETKRQGGTSLKNSFILRFLSVGCSRWATRLAMS